MNENRADLTDVETDAKMDDRDFYDGLYLSCTMPRYDGNGLVGRSGDEKRIGTTKRRQALIGDI